MTSTHMCQTLPEMVQERARRAPDAVAIAAGSVAITHHALNTLTDALAQQLISRGIGPEHIVAVNVNKSPAFIVACMAVLKSGAAYLPLDGAHPINRLQAIVTQSRPSAVIQAERQNGLVWPADCRAVDVTSASLLAMLKVSHRDDSVRPAY